MHARMHKTVKLVESYSTISSHNGVLNSLKLSFSGIEFIESWDPIFAKENPEEDELLGIVSGPRVLSGSPPPILLRVVLLAELIILSRGVEPISPNGGKRFISYHKYTTREMGVANVSLLKLVKPI